KAAYEMKPMARSTCDPCRDRWSRGDLFRNRKRLLSGSKHVARIAEFREDDEICALLDRLVDQLQATLRVQGHVAEAWLHLNASNRQQPAFGIHENVRRHRSRLLRARKTKNPRWCQTGSNRGLHSRL